MRIIRWKNGSDSKFRPLRIIPSAFTTCTNWPSACFPKGARRENNSRPPSPDRDTRTAMSTGVGSGAWLGAVVITENFMTEKQTIKYLNGACRGLNKERKRLRSILNEAADCIQDAAHGHTPNWHRLFERIEKYEDAYAPLGDDC